MQAVILAAGEGKRLRPLTDSLPKPMVRVGGTPILEYTLGILPQEVDEVVVVVGYLGDKVEKYFGNSFGGRRIVYAHQKEPKGPGDALVAARPFLKENHFLLLYGDDLYHPADIEVCMGDVPTVLVKEALHPERFGVCLVDGNDRLLGILEKRKNPPTNLVNIGAYFLNQEIFDVPTPVLPNGELNLAEQIGNWAKRRLVRVVRARFWHPIGYPEDVEAAERFLRLPEEERIN